MSDHWLVFDLLFPTTMYWIGLFLMIHAIEFIVDFLSTFFVDGPVNFVVVNLSSKGRKHILFVAGSGVKF